MARPKKVVAQRDDWQQIEEIQLTDGTRAVKWHNIISGEEAILREGKHPFDSPNAVALPTAKVTAFPVTESSDESEDEEPEDSPTERVAAMLAKVRDKEKSLLRVKKFQQDGSLAWCADYTAEAFEQQGYDGLRRDFGAGKYELALYATNPATRKFSRYGYEIVTIMPAPKGEGEHKEGADVNALAPVLEKLVARIEAIEQKPAPDPMQNLSGVLALVKSMREAFGLNEQRQPQHSTADALKEVAAMLQITKQIREEIEPPPPPDTSLAGVGIEALKVIGQIAGAKSEPETPMPTVAIPPQLSENAANVAVSNPGAKMVPMNPQDARMIETPEMQAFREAISGLNTFARFGAPAASIAEMIYEKAPDEVLTMLIEREDWFEQIKALAPEVGQHEAWYREVHRELLAIWKEAQETPEPEK